MTLLLVLVWIFAVSLCVLGSAYYARRFERIDALVALYVTLVLISNIAAAKVIGYDLFVIQVFAPAATLLFSVTFLLTDIVTEKFGRAESQRMIYIACGAQLAFLVFAYLVLHAHGAPFFTDQTAFQTVLGAVPRLAAAGFVTFFISESLDAYLYAWFRRLTHGKYLWARYVFSTIPAMLLDSALFVTLAFWGTGAPLLSLIVGLTVVKWLVGVVDIPFMYAARAILRK
jgi:uncharacterized integral membrane protein (TIGR00697 family)